MGSSAYSSGFVEYSVNVPIVFAMSDDEEASIAEAIFFLTSRPIRLPSTAH